MIAGEMPLWQIFKQILPVARSVIFVAFLLPAIKSLMWATLFLYFPCLVTVMSNGGELFKVFVSIVASVPMTCRPTDHSAASFVLPHVG